MSKPPTNENEHKAQLVDALLEAMYRNSNQHAQNLVTSGLQQIELDDSVNGIASQDTAKEIQYRRRPSWLMIGLATAALVLISISLPLLDTSHTAVAAVNRSIRQALVDVGRKYNVRTVVRVAPEKTVVRKADLYVRGGDRLAIRAESPFGLPIWLGSVDESAWVVPPIGPVIEGDRNDLIAWTDVQKDLSAPYLHISTFLQRMRDEYNLEKGADLTLAIDSGQVDCDHVMGTLVDTASNQLPDRIELWADAKTGVALKVLADWHRGDGSPGRESVAIHLNEEIELDDQFFTANEHGGLNRMRIAFGSEKQKP